MESFFKSITEGFNAIIASPISMVALAVLFVVIIGYIVFKRIKLTPSVITLTGVTIALTFILNNITLYKMPQGGSITLGSMIPIILLSMVLGSEVGLLAGFLFGLLNLLTNAYILHPIQVLFDYPLPFMMLGFAGIFRLKNGYSVDNTKKKIAAVTIAIFGRFVFHWLSGVVFFGEYAPEGVSPAIYSFLYNGSYLIVEYILCLVLVLILPIGYISKQIRKN